VGRRTGGTILARAVRSPYRAEPPVAYLEGWRDRDRRGTHLRPRSNPASSPDANEPGLPLARNGDREFGHVGCEVDEFGVGGLTDVAAKEGGDGLGDMSPSSDVPGWGSDASAAERFTVEVCRQLLEFLGYWGTL
jgi:hypothetical protein